MAFNFNTAKSYQTTDGYLSMYLVGQLSRDVPFLTKMVNGTLTTPFLLENDDGDVTMANRQKAYKVRDGKLVAVNVPPPPVTIKNKHIKLPSIVVNEGGTTKYYPFVAFNQNAITFHKGVYKGDTVVCFGRWTSKPIPGVGARDLLLVEDVRLIRQSNRRIQAEALEF